MYNMIGTAPITSFGSGKRVLFPKQWGRESSNVTTIEEIPVDLSRELTDGGMYVLDNNENVSFQTLKEENSFEYESSLNERELAFVEPLWSSRGIEDGMDTPYRLPCVQYEEGFFNGRASVFAGLLKITDFEDGMDNEPIREARSYWNQDERNTIYWLANIFYSNRDDDDVMAGLLRVVGAVAGNEPINLLMPLFEEGLRRDSSKVQEAAIMLAEEWRTPECLETLQTATYQSEWIEEYARLVENELKEELGK